MLDSSSALASYLHLIAPYEPFEMSMEDMLSGPSATHWFGVDQFGRDLLTVPVRSENFF
jgi:peptide/nickel transport system permease protein